jgi:disease resistance protein RPM1
MEGIDHQAAMEILKGAMGCLLHMLGKFLKQEHNLQTSTTTKEDLESLERQLRRMHAAALCNMPWPQQDQPDPQDDKHCAYELRELSYDIEDIIDNLRLCFDKGLEPISNHDSFRETLEDIKFRVKNLAASHAGDFVATTSTVGPCLDDVYKGARRLIGTHKLRAMLISRMSSSHRLKKVSIWGAGGMGKTTLAKAVYENIKGDFHCSSFVSIGLQPDMKKALWDILIDIDKERYMVLSMTRTNERQLIDELRHFLRNKRYE